MNMFGALLSLPSHNSSSVSSSSNRKEEGQPYWALHIRPQPHDEGGGVSTHIHDHACHSLFVRFPRPVIERLRHHFYYYYYYNNNDINDTNDNHEQHADDSFWPLQIDFSNGETVYASWNGGETTEYCITTTTTCALMPESSSTHPSVVQDIELPACLVPSCLREQHPQLQQQQQTEICDVTVMNPRRHDSIHPPPIIGDVSRVQPVASHCIRMAESIQLQALTIDDYSILSASTSVAWLENGGFLQQVSVVFSQQVLVLVVPPGIQVVTGQVQRITPVLHNHHQNDTLAESYVCVRLVAQTQVIIVPPTTSLLSSSSLLSNSVVRTLFPSAMDGTPFLRNLAQRLEQSQQSQPQPKSTTTPWRFLLPEVNQGCALVHPNTLIAFQNREGRVKLEQEVETESKAETDFDSNFESENLGSNVLVLLEKQCGTGEGDENVNRDGSAGSIPTKPPQRLQIIVRLSACANVPVSGIVIHPWTRLDLQLDLFVDCVIVKLLPIDRQVQIGRIRQLQADMHETPSNQPRLRLERVRIQPLQHNHQSNDPPVWRYPSCMPWEVDNVEAAEDDAIDIDPTFPDTLSLHAPDDLAFVPLRIGALFSLPWRIICSTSPVSGSNVSTRHRLFRLICVSNDGCGLANDDDDEYVMNGDIPDLLGISALSDSNLKRMPWTTLSRSESPFLIPNIRPLLTSSPSLFLRCLPPAQNAIFSHTLFYGESGSGKTYAALVRASMSLLLHQRRILYLDCQRLKHSSGMRLRVIMDEISAVFRRAIAQKDNSCTIVFDDLDALISHVNMLSDPSLSDRQSLSQSQQQDQLNPALLDQCLALTGLLRYWMRFTQDSKIMQYNVHYVITCRNLDTLSDWIREECTDREVIQLPCLSDEEREHFCHALLHQMTAKSLAWSLAEPGTPATKFGDFAFGSRTVGFRPRDLENVAARIQQAVAADMSLIDWGRCVEQVMENYVPLNRRAASVERFWHDYSLDEVGGLFKAKEELNRTLIQPSRYQRIFENSSVRLPRGILLFGYPGCGKSYIVPALAKECGYSLIMCRGCEILDKYIGASEMKVRELFSRAASVAPSILWIDEIDALAPRRGSDSTGVTDRIVNQLLTFLDGVEDISVTANVYVMATTSRPDKIDPALLRPGRLEKHLFIGPPVNDKEACDVLLKLSKGFHLVSDLKEAIDCGRFYAMLNDIGVSFFHLSPADVRSAFITAQIMAARAAIEASVDNEQQHQHQHQHIPVVSEKQLIDAFRSTNPSLNLSDRAMFNSIYSAFHKIPSDTLHNPLASANNLFNGFKVALM